MKEDKTKMIYINEPYLKLEWDEKSRIILAEWRGFPGSPELRAGLAKGLEVISQHQAVNWLADIRESKVISVADQDYHTTVWTPLAIEQGLKRMAFVVPVDVIAQMALNRIVRQTQGLEVKYFSNVQAARDWLATFSA